LIERAICCQMRPAGMNPCARIGADGGEMVEVFASIGECMVELSPAGEGLYRRNFAGDTLNTAWYMRALSRRSGLAVRYVTAVGDDPMSDEMLRFIEGAGIDTSSIRRIEGRAPGLYMISLDGFERSFTYWRDTSAARLLADDPAALDTALGGVRAAYFSGITLAILSPDSRETLFSALARVRASGGVVAFDPNVRRRLWPSEDVLRETLVRGYTASTLALPTFSDEADLFADRSIREAARRVSGYGVSEMVIKDGPRPCLVSAGGSMTMVPGISVERPVDTTGAGDSFNAGYLSARLSGHEPVEAARRGHLVAARVIGVPGALMPMAALADLET
jgi:2-dehydro-3-deoxygluconokinase